MLQLMNTSLIKVILMAKKRRSTSMQNEKKENN